MGSRFSRKAPVAILLAAATLAVYLPVLQNSFVNYDDDLYITNNHFVRMGLTRESVTWAVTAFHGANWFPLTRLSWMLDTELFGVEPWGFHLTNLLLHCANGVLVFLLFARMTRSIWASAFVAAVFALHPLHVESVAWAAARKDVLSGLFALLALLAYERSTRVSQNRRTPVAVFAWLALGLMAKPTLVTLPFVMLLLDEWPGGRLRRPGEPERWDPGRIRRAVVEKLPLFGLVAVASAVTYLAQQTGGTVQSFELYSLGLRVENALVAGVEYLAKAFWPRGLSVFYPHPGHTLTPGQVVASAILLSTISIAVVAALRRRPYWAVGWFWFVGGLVPVIGLIQVGQAGMADRYTYLPLIGLAASVAWGAGEIAARGRGCARAVAGLGISAVLALAIGTGVQVRIWRDSFTLFEHSLRVTERNHVAHTNLGLAFASADRLDEAAAHFLVAVRLAPGGPIAHGLLGDVRVAQKRPLDARARYRAALDGEPESTRWLTALADVLLQLDRFEQAEAKYRKLIRIRPGSASLHSALGFTLLRAGKLEAAVARYREAIRLDPDRAEVHGRLGTALFRSGDIHGAVDAFRRALALEPDLSWVHAELGRALLDSNRQVEAISAFRAAARLGQRQPTLLNNLAWLLATGEPVPEGGVEEAIALASEAAEATGRLNPAILDTLAVAYHAAGRWEDALITAQEALKRAEAVGDATLVERLQRRVRRLSRTR